MVMSKLLGDLLWPPATRTTQARLSLSGPLSEAE